MKRPKARVAYVHVRSCTSTCVRMCVCGHPIISWTAAMSPRVHLNRGKTIAFRLLGPVWAVGEVQGAAIRQSVRRSGGPCLSAGKVRSHSSRDPQQQQLRGSSSSSRERSGAQGGETSQSNKIGPASVKQIGPSLPEDAMRGQTQAKVGQGLRQHWA